MSNEHGESDDTPTESETTGTVGNFPHGSRETPETSVFFSTEADRSEKARGHSTDMDVIGESDSFIVPEKPANKGGVPQPAELVEGRELTKENAEQSLLDRTQSRKVDGTPFEARSRGLLGVREAARMGRKQKFTSLMHHITPDLLRASFFELKKQAAPGIDGEGVTTRSSSSSGSKICMNASIAERTGPSPPSGPTSPSLTAGCARWESLPWRTRSSNRRHARSWNVFTNKTFWGSVTAFVPDVAVTKPWMPCLWVSAGAR